MGIKRSTLYYQPKKNINKKQKELRIRKKIEEISREHTYYGYRRITAEGIKNDAENGYTR